MAAHAIALGQRLVVGGLSPRWAAAVVAELSSQSHEVTVVLGREFAGVEVEGAQTVHDTGDAADLEAALVVRQPSLCLLLERRLGGWGSSDHVDRVDEVAEEHFALGMRLAHAFAAAGGASFVYGSSHERWVDGVPQGFTTLQDVARHAFSEVLRYYALQEVFRVLDLACPPVWEEVPGRAVPERLPSAAGLLEAVRSATLQAPWWCEGDLVGEAFLPRVTGGSELLQPLRPRFADHLGWR